MWLLDQLFGALILWLLAKLWGLFRLVYNLARASRSVRDYILATMVLGVSTIIIQTATELRGQGKLSSANIRAVDNLARRASAWVDRIVERHSGRDPTDGTLA
jgi:hypothetical protein